MRGVFFILLFSLGLNFVAEAVEISGSYQGRLDRHAIERELVFAAAHKGAHLDAQGGGSFLFEAGGVSFKPHWQVRVSDENGLSLYWTKNKAHHTSQDLFRVLHKDNLGPATTALILAADQVRLGMLGSVPLRTGELADLWFCENYVRAGPLVLRGMQLHHRGPVVGRSASLEALLDLGTFRAVLGQGWQQRQDLSRASIAEIGVGAGRSFLNFFWQRVEAGFVSLAAKSNKYTPDRRGWRVEAGTDFGGVRLSFNLRRHSNLAQTRTYDQFSLKCVSLGEDASVELRLQPTRALILRRVAEACSIQLDVLNGTARYDGQRGMIAYGLRFDGPNGIGRLEIKFERGLQGRIIAKYDWLKKRLYYSLMLRRNAARGHVQLELGEYDRGNMGAGFSTSPALGISWQCKF